MKNRLSRYLQRLHNRDRGTVAVTFLVSLPILLFVLAVIVQYAMIVNARIVLNRAAAGAARSAMTALSTDPRIETVGDGPGAPALDGVAFVKMAACERLESISPIAPSPAGVANTDTQTIENYGFSINQSYGQRYDYADQATTIHWQVVDDLGNPIGQPDPPPSVLCHCSGQHVQLTVSYQFYLNVPGAKLFIGSAGNVAGVDGRFITLNTTYDLQLSHGRETMTYDDGSPVPYAAQVGQ
ncbi:MAG: TadE/TadG family type IV pilus assembly protein [Phycisphaerae bacterium]